MTRDVREWHLSVRQVPDPVDGRQGWLARRFSHPLSVPIVAGVLAIVASSASSFFSGWQARELERQKADYARITLMINDPDPDKVAANFQFLLDANLISDEEIKSGLAAYLATRALGTGPTAIKGGEAEAWVTLMLEAIKGKDLGIDPGDAPP